MKNGGGILISAERKRTIVNEIRYWKESRLLPNEYCDFLLALYSEGEEQSDASTGKIRKRLHFRVFFLGANLILLPLSFLVIYFTEMGIIMQTGLLSSFVGVSFVYFFWLKNRRLGTFHIPLISGLLIALLTSVSAADKMLPNDWILYFIVCIHCALWIWLYRQLRIPYLLISGITGIIVMIGFILFW